MRASRLKVILIALGVIAATPLIVNSPVFDQPLDGEAAQALAAGRMAGREADETYSSILALGNGQTKTTRDWQDRYTRCTSRTQLGCLALLQEQVRMHPVSDHPELANLMDQYSSIITNTSFSAPGNPSYDAPWLPWGLMLQLGNLRLALLSIEDHGAFLDALAEDTRFWEMIFRDGPWMLDKMVAVSAIWSRLQFLAEYGDSVTLDRGELLRLQRFLAGLEIDIRQLDSAFTTEFAALGSVLQPLDTEQLAEVFAIGTLQARWLLQPEATLNLNYQRVIGPARCATRLGHDELIILAGESPPPDLCPDDGYTGAGLMQAFFYNPVGRALVAKAGNGQDYIYRVRDLDGIRALLVYKFSSKAEAPGADITPASVTLENGIIAQRKDGLLSFPCLDKSSVCGVQL